MPTVYESIHYRSCNSAEYKKLNSVDENSIYFLSDTHQLFVGSSEYTKSVLSLTERPSDDTEGEEGRIYICEDDNSTFAYIGGRWVAVYDSTWPNVKHINAGNGIVCTPNPITTDGTVSHYIPSGASAIDPDTTQVILNFGEVFSIHEVKTDEFGHVTELVDKPYKMPSADEISTVFRFKGTVNSVDDLPQQNNAVGDVYYVVTDSAEYVYLESGWEKLGPIVDTSNFIQKVPDDAGHVAMITEDGSISSAGYTPESGVSEGQYGSVSDEAVNVPCLDVDTFGRITSASNSKLGIADPEYLADIVCWSFEQVMM